ncbi:MAG TPA: DUF6600 domain-containing protein [Ramlibacter sp.]|nr:DUF6600 domain-containing protein [Ramlibacter sp.]
MDSVTTSSRQGLRSLLARWLAVALLCSLSGVSAWAQSDPPLRAGSLSSIQGSTVFAPAGQTEWIDATINRPVTPGDRLWTDRGGRAELHLGTSVLHMDSQAFLDVVALDEDVFQASLNGGSVAIRVRELRDGENVEIDTAQLAFRAAQPGDYLIAVDPVQGTTRVTVRNGMALVFGASGQTVQLRPGPQHAFTGRNLQPALSAPTPVDDDFARWVGQQNRQEDQSASARYLPRDVVGYSQLDTYGSWAQDASYGPVWYPRVKIADWAPYRYGRWDWIAQWGWTWIDDAPWGFAPFHYGRWTLIGARWGWVPGRLGSRPVYAPALVAFTSDPADPISSAPDPGIGWFPLAPGEAWRPSYRASVAYLRDVNRFVVGTNIAGGIYFFQGRPEATTMARVDDFIHGRLVHSHWRKASSAQLARAQVIVPPALVEPGR